MEAAAFQFSRALGIAGIFIRSRMCDAVHFYDQLSFQCHEINDILFNGVLAPEFPAG